jgi:hypothetical protein
MNCVIHTPLRVAFAASLACLEPLVAFEAPTFERDASAIALRQNSQNLLLLFPRHIAVMYAAILDSIPVKGVGVPLSCYD